MIDKIKLALRIKTDDFNEEINDLINACKRDLALAGVRVISEDDPLILRAITLYCKANFGYGDEKGTFQNAYSALRISLSLAGDYVDIFDNKAD